tara:strand:- start:362 stop:526 length:165 start_codon:yes stop_codon:yes gene_type:complete
MMIRPNMALTYFQAKRVEERKGIWMVEYLRARRSKSGRRFCRRQFFKDEKERDK